MKLLKYYILLLTVIGISDGYKILALLPLNGKSHMVMFETIMKGLALKGHEVDVYSPFSLKKPIPGYNEFLVKGLSPEVVNNVPMSFILETFRNSDELTDFIFEGMGLHICRAFLNTTLARDLKNSEKKYDLLLTEIFGTDCMVAFGHHFDIPVVSMISSVNLPWATDRIGNLDNPSYIPNYFTPYSPKMGFFERIHNLVSLNYFKYKHNSVTARSNEILKDFFGPDLPDLESLIHKTSLILVNSHLSINFARPTVPNFIEVGGVHIEEPKKLLKELEETLNVTTNYKGVVYFSMGSMVMTETMEITKLKGMLDAFAELPYKVIWKANRNKMPKEITIPKNIELYTWLPQVDVLCNSNVKLFVSHGGLMGSQEAIYCGVPVLGIPLFADQRLNLKQLANHGMSLTLEYDDITKTSVSETMASLLNDERYKNNAERISKLFKDRPLTPLETAVFWVEYVIRYNGAPHIRTAGSDLSWYQYCLLDIALTVLIIVGIVFYLVTLVGRKLFCKIASTKTKSD